MLKDPSSGSINKGKGGTYGEYPCNKPLLAVARCFDPANTDPGEVNPVRGQTPAGVEIKNISRGSKPGGVRVKNFSRGQTPAGVGQ